MKSPYSHIELDRQEIRAVFALYALGDTLLKLPALTGTAADKNALDRVSKWWSLCVDEICADEKRTKYGSQFFLSWNRYKKATANSSLKRDFRKAANYMAASMLILDGRVTCPACARTRNWYYLAKASGSLEDYLMKKFPGCDEAGTDIYEKICWEAERREQ